MVQLCMGIKEALNPSSVLFNWTCLYKLLTFSKLFHIIYACQLKLYFPRFYPRYLHGGAASGFNHVEHTIKSRLLHVKGKSTPRIKEVREIDS